MAWAFGGAVMGSLVKLACPHCREVQARARKPAGERYRCRACHRLFTREEGEAAARHR